MINDNAIELFFANLDEDTMEELVNIYESGDKVKLIEYLDKLSNNVPKEELIESLSMLIEMKEMMWNFSEIKYVPLAYITATGVTVHVECCVKLINKVFL